MLSLRSPTITSQSSRCGHSRGRSRSRKITYNTITKKQEQQMIGESITFRISDEDGNIVEIEAERTISMQEVFDSYAKRKKCVPTYYMIFILNGVIIKPYQTPNILDLKDGDLILEMKVGASRLFESLVALQHDNSNRTKAGKTLPTNNV
mmetsp:Transcript_9414/g.16106  ORF Transcript_9414/g.16106 Transcript_9414/m.16106 type:complete len:150 (+) Transcript_9414:2-451(+)